VRLLDAATARLRVVRGRRPFVDHAVRAYDRHSEVSGGQVAAAVTYYGFLSFFPLVALTFAVVGYVSVLYPGAREQVTTAVESAFPGLVGTGSGQINLDDVVGARAGAGIVGVLGLLYAGLGWIDALRTGLRRVFGTEATSPSFVRQKTGDVVVLLLLGVALLASLGVSTLATDATQYALGQVGLAGSFTASAVLKVLAVLLALTVDTVLFAILFARLPGADVSWHQVRSGARLGAVGFELLKLLGTFLLARTTDNPVYATFGVLVGLLVWINLVSTVLVYAACWTATEAYSLLPAGPDGRGAGRRTGLAASSDPVTAVAPADYEPVPAAVPASSAGRTRTVRGVLLGAVAGAGIMALIGRRSRR